MVRVGQALSRALQAVSAWGRGPHAPRRDDAPLREARREAEEQARLKAKREHLMTLVAATPGAQEQISALLERTRATLSPEDQLALAFDAAQRLNTLYLARQKL